MKIVTALGNPEWKIKLEKKGLNIINQDIQYKEGILEYLENNKEINYLIILDELNGNITLQNLIYKIQEINNKIKIIILITKENKHLIKFLKIKKIKCLFLNNENKLNKINYLIYKKRKIKNKIKINRINYKKLNKIKNKSKIYLFFGLPGIGKTTIISNLFKSINLNKKILLINLNYDNSLKIIFNIKNKKNNIIKINKNKYLFLNNKKINKNNLKKDIEEKINIINKFKNNYDFIFVDLGSEYFKINSKILEKLFKLSTESILIIRNGKLDIEKNKKLINKLKISKLNILINEEFNYGIDKEIIKNIFNKYNFIGNVNLNKIKIKEKINYLKIINKLNLK